MITKKNIKSIKSKLNLKKQRQTKDLPWKEIGDQNAEMQCK
jgi:hypothetical protein